MRENDTHTVVPRLACGLLVFARLKEMYIFSEHVSLFIQLCWHVFFFLSILICGNVKNFALMVRKVKNLSLNFLFLFGFLNERSFSFFITWWFVGIAILRNGRTLHLRLSNRKIFFVVAIFIVLSCIFISQTVVKAGFVCS